MVTFPLAHQSALALRAALPGGAVAVEKFDRGTHPPKRPELAMAADFIRRRLSSTEGLGPMPPGTEAGAAVGVETTADAALASCVGEGSGSGGDGGGSGGDVRGCSKGQGGGGGGEGGGSGGEGGGGRGGKGGPSSSVPRVYSPLERSGTARTCEAAPAPPRSPPPPPSPPRVAAPLPSLLRREVTRTFALGGAKLPPLILTLTLTTHPTPTPNLTPAPNANQATLAFDPAEHELHAATVSLLRSLGDRYGTFTVTEATGGAAGGAVGGAAGDAAARGCLLAGYRPAQGNPFTNFRLSQRLYAAGARDERLLSAYDRLVVSVVLPHLKALLAQAGGAEGGGAEGGGAEGGGAEGGAEAGAGGGAPRRGALQSGATTFWYQRPPSVRLQPPDSLAFCRAHDDAEYGHQVSEVNFYSTSIHLSIHAIHPSIHPIHPSILPPIPSIYPFSIYPCFHLSGRRGQLLDGSDRPAANGHHTVGRVFAARRRLPPAAGGPRRDCGLPRHALPPPRAAQPLVAHARQPRLPSGHRQVL